ncbi:MAG: zinc-binding dehydrogenase [Candidatus Nanopelagicales bacterium]
MPAFKARRLPDESDFLLGATLGVPAVTAAHCLIADGSVHGRDVLVHGGAGAVGRCGIELGRWSGARVVATVSSEAKAEVARACGAELVVDYRREDVASVIRGFSAGIHRVLEVSLAANASIDAEVCGLNAVVVVFGTEGGEATLPVRPPLFKSLSFRFILLYNFSREELERAAGEVERALDDGALTLAPITRFSLDDITVGSRASGRRPVRARAPGDSLISGALRQRTTALPGCSPNAVGENGNSQLGTSDSQTSLNGAARRYWS